ncbi:riboflavin aldehyde-forming enzyme, partial [Saitoella complicata NRRL Y-17804]
SGEGTFYTPGLGACGQTSSSTDAIVAISHSLFDSASTSSNPNENPMCGKMITAFYEGKSVSVQVVDRCEGCAEGDLDFSPSAFGELAAESAGRIGITWEW